MVFDKGDNLSECFRIMQSDIRQRFPIKGDLRPFEARHELTIREPMQARCSINTDNPQLAEIPLTDFAITVCKLPTAFNRLASPPKELSPGSTIALRMVEQTLMTPRCHWAACRSWHDTFPSKHSLLDQQVLRQAEAS